MISFEGLSRAEVLAGLYNAARPQGRGFLEYDSEPMTVEEAEEILKQQSYFDYLKGRVMKISLLEGKTGFDEWLYDRDNGLGAAERVINELRTKGINSETIQKQQNENL
jgi:hypothetical protein